MNAKFDGAWPCFIQRKDPARRWITDPIRWKRHVDYKCPTFKYKSTLRVERICRNGEYFKPSFPSGAISITMDVQL